MKRPAGRVCPLLKAAAAAATALLLVSCLTTTRENQNRVKENQTYSSTTEKPAAAKEPADTAVASAMSGAEAEAESGTGVGTEKKSEPGNKTAREPEEEPEVKQEDEPEVKPEPDLPGPPVYRSLLPNISPPWLPPHYRSPDRNPTSAELPAPVIPESGPPEAGATTGGAGAESAQARGAETGTTQSAPKDTLTTGDKSRETDRSGGNATRERTSDAPGRTVTRESSSPDRSSGQNRSPDRSPDQNRNSSQNRSPGQEASGSVSAPEQAAAATADTGRDPDSEVQKESGQQRTAASKSPESPEPAGRQEEADRTVWAVPGEKIDIALPGYGWVYRGEPQQKGQPVQFSRRNYDKGQTFFVFEALEMGRKSLRFYREDAEEGSRTERLITVAVVTREERSRRVAQAGAGEGSVQAEGAGTAGGDHVTGRPGQAERSGNTGPRPGRDGEIQAGEIQAGENGEGENGNPREQALRLLQESQRGRTEPIDVARSLLEKGEELVARELLQLYLNALGQDDYRRGDALYLLGKLYEAPGPLRDERRAVDYYDRAVRGFPGSSYWHKAQERSRYLKRNYIYIR